MSIRSSSVLWELGPRRPGSFRDGSDLAFPAAVPLDFSQMLRHYTTDGFRVLALASKPLGAVSTFQEALQLPRLVPTASRSVYVVFAPSVSRDAWPVPRPARN